MTPGMERFLFRSSRSCEKLRICFGYRVGLGVYLERDWVKFVIVGLSKAKFHDLIF